MKKYLYTAFIFFLFFSAHGSVEYHFVYKQNEISIRQEKLQKTVESALNLSDKETPYYRAVVAVYASEITYADYLVVDLYRKDSYLIEPVRLDLKGDSVIAITYDYYEVEEPDPIACYTCPDPEVEFVISYIEDALFPGAIEHGWGTWSKMTTQWGIKCALVIGLNENKQTMLNYLSCPKLVGWGRIGHGLRDCIKFNQWTEKLTAEEVVQYKDILKDKIFIFNSCLAHNDPFESAMMEAGVKFFGAGDISLSGKKEFVFSNFFTNAIQNNMELSAAMQQAQLNYPNAWGWSSPTSGSLYFNLDMTPLEPITSKVSNTFSLITQEGQIKFSTPLSNKPGELAIYDLSGKKIFSNNLTEPTFLWNMKTTTGNTIAPGNYMAVIKNGEHEKSNSQKITITGN